MENLSKLRHNTKIKMIIMILSTSLPLVITLVMSICNFEISDNSLFAALPFLPSLMCVVFEGYIILKIIQYIRILKNDDYAQSLIIRRNDERIKYITLKSNAFVDKLFAFILGLAVLFTAFVDASVFLPCFSIFIVFVIIHFIAYIYYSRKY